MTEFISPDAVETTEPAPTLAPENDTAGLPIVTYCVTAKQAKAALQEMLDDADGRLLGLDIETTASPAEAARLKSIELRQAALKGELKAARNAKAPASEIAAIEAEQKAAQGSDQIRPNRRARSVSRTDPTCPGLRRRAPGCSDRPFSDRSRRAPIAGRSRY